MDYQRLRETTLSRENNYNPLCYHCREYLRDDIERREHVCLPECRLNCYMCSPPVSYTESDLFHHLIRAHNTCPQCFMQFDTYGKLAEHRETNHVPQLRCLGCPLIFTSIARLRRHYEATSCLVRGENLLRDLQARRGVERGEEEESERRVSCPRCGVVMLARDFVEHIQGGVCGFNLQQGGPMERFVEEMRRQRESPDSDVTLIGPSPSAEDNRRTSDVYNDPSLFSVRGWYW